MMGKMHGLKEEHKKLGATFNFEGPLTRSESRSKRAQFPGQQRYCPHSFFFSPKIR